MERLKNLAYYSDSRVTTSKWWTNINESKQTANFDNGEQLFNVKIEWGVCPLCRGRGRHVNPSVDAHGLSAEDFYEDPDFAKSYLEGDYDIICNLCNGRTTVPIPVGKEDRNRIDEYLRVGAEIQAEHLAELKMGA